MPARFKIPDCFVCGKKFNKVHETEDYIGLGCKKCQVVVTMANNGLIPPDPKKVKEEYGN